MEINMTIQNSRLFILIGKIIFIYLEHNFYATVWKNVENIKNQRLIKQEKIC